MPLYPAQLPEEEVELANDSKDNGAKVVEARKRVGKLAMVAGSVGAHIIAPLILGLMYSVLMASNGGVPPMEWGSFLLHPLLMTLAYGFLAPLGSVGYVSYERLLGLSHSKAKLVHTTIQGAAVVIGGLGIRTMWIKHDALQAAGILGGSGQPPTHYQTGHSYVGAAVYAVFVLQWIGGLLIYLLPARVPPVLKKALLPLHILLGCIAVFGSLASINTGILSWRGVAGRSLDPKDLILKSVSLLTFLLAVLLALALAAPRS